MKKDGVDARGVDEDGSVAARGHRRVFFLYGRDQFVYLSDQSQITPRKAEY